MKIKSKLTDRFKTVFNDLTNQEKKITRHFINHATSLAKDSKHIDGILSLQILKLKDCAIGAILCKGKTAIKEISLDKIALFFTDSFTANLITKTRIEEKIETYLKSFQTHPQVHYIGIRIVVLKNEEVKIYTLGTKETLEVPLNEFIHFFKS